MNESYRGSEAGTELTASYAYRAAFRDGSTYWYTNWNESIQITGLPAAWSAADPQTFTAIPIRHEAVERQASFQSNSTVIEMASVNAELQRYFSSPAADLIEVSIIRISSDDLARGTVLDYDRDCKLIQGGEINNVSFIGANAGFEITPHPFGPNAQTPRFWFQPSCNHQLYGPGCGVSKAGFQLDTTILAVDQASRKITVEGQHANDVDGKFFEYGYFEHKNTDLIVGIEASSKTGSDTVITATFLLPEIAAGEFVLLQAGCDLTMGLNGCTKFDNHANFAGFPHVPNKNITFHGV
jgi:hypothetical protein